MNGRKASRSARSDRPQAHFVRPGAAPRQNRLNLADLAYDKCEELLVTCQLKPGLYLAIQDLQDVTGFGRTPIHQAVSRLADDTLVIVRPRHGLRIAPIDLGRERTLLQLRRDMRRSCCVSRRSGRGRRTATSFCTSAVRYATGPTS